MRNKSVFSAGISAVTSILAAPIEGVILLAVGILLLGFGGTRWTARYVDAYIRYVRSVCARLLVISVLGWAALASPLASAGTMTGGATMPEQIVQEVTLLQSKVTQAQQLVQQVQQYENMVQNMATLPQSMYNQITAPIAQLYGMAQQAQQLGYAGQNIASQFQNINGTFNPQITAQYSQQYGTITSGLNNAINNALQTANLNPSNFTTQQQAMQQVQQAMNNPTSRNAILQAGVSVGQAEVSDLTQLQQTATAEQNMNAAWKKAQLAKQTADHQYASNGIAAAFGGGPLTSNAPSLAAYSLSGY
ncbi:conjugal transfer protein TrbJ [Acidithiobacillus ferriphilus]|uniref:conjugal transfer protein TrbJ n=1 Tax=Acidithiobacillus ferriphilus TaxID=1689834 RepID=UPI001C06DD93|nr:conjugal transfer protein TrbJ [Acidithiobacillus ferriphilus]MBU2833009.1 conjugal transfer protein TrbJ [Acidithiobacillus ferriphilus]